MLTVEFNKEAESVEIHCDAEGLEMLLYQLEVLERSGGHVHLRTPGWAGYELTDQPQGVGTTLVNHLVIGMQQSSGTGPGSGSSRSGGAGQG